MSSVLTSKQKLFCQYFVSGVETCGNGVQAYAKAYGYALSNNSKYQSAKSNANRLLRNPEVIKYIESLFEEQKLTADVVDQHLDFLIRQHENLSVKLQAIAVYYRYRQKQEGIVDQVGVLGKRASDLARRYVDIDALREEFL